MANTNTQTLNVTLNDISDDDECYNTAIYNMAIYNYLLYATNDEDEIQTIINELETYQESLCFGEEEEDDDDEQYEPTLNVTLNDISDDLYNDEGYNMAIYDYLLHATNDEYEIQTINDEIESYQEALGFNAPVDQNTILMAEVELLINQIIQQNIPIQHVHYSGQSMCLSY